MNGLISRFGSALLLGMAGLLLAGCAGKNLTSAPVEDRGTAIGKTLPVEPAPVKVLPGAENAGKPGYYTVKPGDTLIRIGLDNGQSSKDIARWSALENPNLIEVGQVLRVAPPGQVPATGVVTKPVSTPSAKAAALAPVAAGTAEKPAAAPAPIASSAPAPVAAAAAGAAVAGANGEDEIAWIWPTHGTVLAGFDEVKNKGLDIGGTAGEPVLAAADGRVVYVGAGLRGYGNLIILKHNNTYLTAYAHNQTLLIKEDQSVRKGQKIAEMGSTDADRVKLHFEVRRQGKPVDPVKYLPPR